MRYFLFFLIPLVYKSELNGQANFHKTYQFFDNQIEVARDIHILDDGLLVLGYGINKSEIYTYILKLSNEGDTLWTEKYFNIFGQTDNTYIKDSSIYIPGYHLLPDGTYETSEYRLYQFDLEGQLKNYNNYTLENLSDPPVDEISSYQPTGVIGIQDKLVIYGMIYEANHGQTTKVFSRGLLAYLNEDMSYDTMVVVQPRFEECQIFDAHIDAHDRLTILVDDDLEVVNANKKNFRGFVKYDIDGNRIWEMEPFELAHGRKISLSFKILTNQDLVTFYEDDNDLNSHFLVSFSDEGKLNWKFQVDPFLSMDGRFVINVDESHDGHILISGVYTDNPGDRQGAYIAKHNRDNGELLWERVYQDWREADLQIRDLSKKIEVYSMKVDDSGRIYMTGDHLLNSGDIDLAVISVDESGCLQPNCGGFNQTVAGVPKYNQMFYSLAGWIEQDPKAPEGFYHHRYVFRGSADIRDSIYSQISYTSEIHPQGGSNLVLGSKYQIRNGGRQVYIIEDQDTFLLYDFTLKIGDSFYTEYTPYNLKVIASDTILLLNGAKRRTWTLACTENSQNTITWIEGIGSHYGMSWPKNFCAGDYGNVRLTCYYVYERLHYVNPDIGGCFISSTDDEQYNSALSTITIFPNPTSSRLTISSPELGIQRVDILDVQGQTQSVHYDNVREMQYDLQGYVPGLYFFSVHTEKGYVVKKVVVE